MRLWAVGRLEKVAEVMGIRKAKVLAQVLKTQHEVAWLGVKDKRGWQEFDVQDDAGQVRSTISQTMLEGKEVSHGFM